LESLRLQTEELDESLFKLESTLVDEGVPEIDYWTSTDDFCPPIERARKAFKRLLVIIEYQRTNLE